MSSPCRWVGLPPRYNRYIVPSCCSPVLASIHFDSPNDHNESTSKESNTNTYTTNTHPSPLTIYTMKTITTLTTFTSLLATTQAQYFRALATRAGSPINLLPINAAGLRLWIGGETASYCPTVVQAQGGCPNTTGTNFANGNQYLDMGAVVPGGQQVYVEPTCGAVSYTQAHSAYMPAGAITDGWTVDPGSFYSSLSWRPWKKGLVACNTSVGGPWGVYGVLDGVTPPGDCVEFHILTLPQNLPAAWQYI